MRIITFGVPEDVREAIEATVKRHEKKGKLSAELKALITKYKEDITCRDMGVQARKTLDQIKELATPEEYVKICDDLFPRFIY